MVYDYAGKDLSKEQVLTSKEEIEVNHAFFFFRDN